MLWPAVAHTYDVHVDLLAALVRQPIDVSQLHAWPDAAIACGVLWAGAVRSAPLSGAPLSATKS